MGSRVSVGNQKWETTNLIQPQQVRAPHVSGGGVNGRWCGQERSKENVENVEPVSLATGRDGWRKQKDSFGLATGVLLEGGQT